MTKPIDFSKLPNPYDFANPITEPALFSGRTTEIQEINYYLDHAKGAPRPINIALLGPRASGKTSLLNMIEYESVKRDFCVARVDLDEGDVSGQLAFFYKIFDSVLFCACPLTHMGALPEKLMTYTETWWMLSRPQTTNSSAHFSFHCSTARL